MCLILKYAQLTRLRALMYFEINIINCIIKYKLSETHTYIYNENKQIIKCVSYLNYIIQYLMCQQKGV